MREELLYPYEKEYLKIVNRKILIERLPIIIALIIVVGFPVIMKTTYIELVAINNNIASFYNNMLPIIFGVIIALSIGQLLIMKGSSNSLASKEKDMSLNLGDSYLMEKIMILVILMFGIGGFIAEIGRINSASYLELNKHPFITVAGIILVLYLIFKQVFNAIRKVTFEEVIESTMTAINEEKYVEVINVLEEEGKNLSIWGVEYTLINRYLILKIKKAYENRNEISEEELYSREVVTNICHDLRTPLTSIINYSTILKRDDISKEEIEEFEEILAKKVERLHSLKEEVSTVIKADTEDKKEEVNIKELILEVIENNRDKSKCIKIEVRENNELILFENRLILGRIIQNLISNIYKYSNKDSVATISIEGRDILFENESSEEIDESPERLVRRFIRGDKSRNTSGYGLGLDIVKNLVDQIGGSLKINIEEKRIFKVKIGLLS